MALTSGSQLKNPLGTSLALVLFILTLIPFGLGSALILSGYIYTPMVRWGGYELSWTLFGLIFVVAAAFKIGSPLMQIRSLSRTDTLAIAMVCFVLVFSSVVFAPLTSFALYYSATLAIAALVGLSSARLAADIGMKYVRAVCLALFGGILLHSLVVFWFMFLERGNSDLGWAQFAAPSFTNMRHYNFSLEIAVVLAAGLFASTPSPRWARPLIFIGACILWSLLFWTGARGAILAIIVSFAITMAIVPAMLRLFLSFSITSAAIGAIISLIYWLPDSRFGVFNIAARTIDAQSANQLSSSRMQMWTEAVNLISNNPLFGYGPGQFAFLTNIQSFKINLHPHNAALDMLLSVGVIGTIFLIFLLVKLWFKVTIQTRITHPPLTIAIFWAVNSLITHSMLAGSLFVVHSRISFAILIGILVAGRISKAGNSH